MRQIRWMRRCESSISWRSNRRNIGGYPRGRRGSRMGKLAMHGSGAGAGAIQREVQLQHVDSRFAEQA
jgi:hypothetical protein